MTDYATHCFVEYRQSAAKRRSRLASLRAFWPAVCPCAALRPFPLPRSPLCLCPPLPFPVHHLVAAADGKQTDALIFFSLLGWKTLYATRHCRPSPFARAAYEALGAKGVTDTLTHTHA